MRKIFTLCLILFAGSAVAQPFNNEWIDYSKTYYKFKVTADGLYRIPANVLASAGLSAADAKDFQLFRNGVEVPVYTSVSSGPLSPADYIEFWGQMNDGKPDKPLYRNPAYQHTDKWSLQSDTAVYFLTLNPSGVPFHYSNIANDTTSNILPVSPYFMYTAGTYFRSQINPGLAAVLEQYIYSSSYDIGEFWSSNYSSPGAPVTDAQNNLYIYNGGPNANFKFGAAGCSDTLRTIQVKVNNILFKDTTLNSFSDIVSNISIPVASLNTTTTPVEFDNNSQALTYADRLVVSFYELTYPRQFNFGGQSNFPFQLASNASGYFLKITNFNQGAATPVLYDRNSGQRFVAISSAGMLTFALPGSGSVRNLVLVSQDLSNIHPINNLVKRNFISYADPSNQGNYLIISNPILYTGSHSNNPVADYKGYRSSAAGGSYNAQIMDINELTDQFAFGIQKHPLAIKNFINYAANVFGQKPQYVLLIGRAVTYAEYRQNQGNSAAELLNLVPSFGYPASDVMLASANGAGSVNLIPIGRIGAVTGSEVDDYLQKIKDYESAQQNAPNNIDGRAWKKNVMQVTGATDPFLEAVLCNYMAYYRQTISDTLFGANVYGFCSSAIDQSNQVSNTLLPQLYSKGLGVFTYFGHSSASTLGFQLDDPSIFTNQSKYPVMYVNGCYAGNYYTFDPGRLTNSKTIDENYVLIKNKGAIAFVASTHFGVVNYLNLLLTAMYDLMSHNDYGKSIGTIEANAGSRILASLPTDFLARCQTEQMNIHGDPAVFVSDEKLPDYDVEAQTVVINPSFISVSSNFFNVSATFYNLGKAVSDSITVLITRKYPDGSTSILLKKRIRGIRYSDSVNIQVPIVGTRDKGQNYITVTINSDNNVTETTLANNTVTSSVFIYQDELTPIYPYNYAIINTASQHLFASTANPFAPLAQYVMEMDTTEAFNSAAKVSKNITSVGGVFEFDPGVKFRDSTVYYWRTSIVPAQNSAYHWNEFSFVYIDSLRSTVGFNQSHYFQNLQSTPGGMNLLGDRLWHYGMHTDNIYIRQAMYPTSGVDDADFSVIVNGSATISSACLGQSLIFNVIDDKTFIPWKNVDALGNNLYRFGSASANCGPGRQNNFEFSYTTPASRKLMMDFMDSVPIGDYVVVRSIDYNYNASFSKTWEADTSIYGSNKSLYHYLLSAGFLQIDSINQPRDWALVYKKGNNGYTPVFKYSQGLYDNFILSTDVPVPNLTASMTSPIFGPAKQWKQVHWRGTSLESPSTDSVGVQVIGVDTSGNQNVLYSLNSATQDFDISAVNVRQYPFIQLKLNSTDSVNATPFQLTYWRLNYLPVPEGALAPNIFLSGKDSVELGEQVQFGIAFKNVSLSSFDSLKISFKIIDKNNVTHVIPFPKGRPLISGDTIKIVYTIDSKLYPGLNTINLDVNPGNDQPEQYHFNNFLFKTLYVKVDQTNPLLDVTFDNVHILNEDIVSAKPHILIKLKDESKFLLLNDTSVLKVQLRYPDGSLHPYYFNNDTLRFIPATSSADNTASVEFNPAFLNQINPQGDEYTLIVTGSDKSGNSSGTIQYQVTFKIITKAMISNMLNYPNPFTTSTAFVFTITGSDVPQNIKIQILTITGKVVREITKDQLGPLHVGRNITEFKWDGTDMYNQRLAIGVYLYHVVTNLNGKTLDKYTSQSDNTDQYFNKGYGKMFLMK
ncbi:MAG TPA: C25 family cysteine peptidase [Puia sp.]